MAVCRPKSRRLTEQEDPKGKRARRHERNSSCSVAGQRGLAGAVIRLRQAVLAIPARCAPQFPNPKFAEQLIRRECEFAAARCFVNRVKTALPDRTCQHDQFTPNATSAPSYIGSTWTRNGRLRPPLSMQWMLKVAAQARLRAYRKDMEISRNTFEKAVP